MNNIVLITGATSGFGKASAEKFAANGYDVIITGRRKERLDEIKNELSSRYKTKILALEFDVQDKQAVFNAIENIPEEWKKIDILINNAGLALGRDRFDEADLSDWETMINTNVHGLLYVSKAVLPYLIKQKKVTSLISDPQQEKKCMKKEMFIVLPNLPWMPFRKPCASTYFSIK